MEKVECLFLDIGGVLLSNGWDHQLRQKTADRFDVDYEQMNKRHGVIFDTFELGKVSFDFYLKQVFFDQPRQFTLPELKQYIFDAATPYVDMLNYVKELKKSHDLKIAVVSNEGKELAQDRFKRFDFQSFVDFFVVSSFVHYRKPDPVIYQLAIDLSQIPISRIIYIDDREMLIESASSLVGLHGIHHKGFQETKAQLNRLFALTG